MTPSSGQPVQQTRRSEASIDRGRSTMEETPAGRTIAPTCAAPGCARPVQRRVTGRRRIPAIGLREIDGVVWCWFCSRSCAGRTRGRECAAKRFWVRNFGQDQEGRITALTRQRRQGVAEDLDTLRRYGVPRVIAEAVLDRVAVRFDHRGYNRAWHRLAPKRQAS